MVGHFSWGFSRVFAKKWGWARLCARFDGTGRWQRRTLARAGRRKGQRLRPRIHKTGPEPALRQQVNCLESGFPLGPP